MKVNRQTKDYKPIPRDGESRSVPPKDRILSTAVRLFQTQGYSNTGINQIIAESKTAKASFYDYFPSKDHLGRAFIIFYGEEQLILLERLKTRSKNVQAFIHGWTQILRRQTRNSEFAGCSMANTVAQISFTSAKIAVETRAIAKRTIEFLNGYIVEEQKKGHIPKSVNPEIAARRVFACYEGVLQSWRLTGEISALDDLPLLVESVFHLE